ncbi:MAG: hypothetical protein ACI875_002147, partial [Planctomycetota bacterium]
SVIWQPRGVTPHRSVEFSKFWAVLAVLPGLCVCREASYCVRARLA